MRGTYASKKCKQRQEKAKKSTVGLIVVRGKEQENNWQLTRLTGSRSVAQLKERVRKEVETVHQSTKSPVCIKPVSSSVNNRATFQWRSSDDEQ